MMHKLLNCTYLPHMDIWSQSKNYLLFKVPQFQDITARSVYGQKRPFNVLAQSPLLAVGWSDLLECIEVTNSQDLDCRQCTSG
jgi:hypothetical protein